MATGTITSLGIGSSLDLQGILDSLRKADETSITRKQNEKTNLDATKNEFNTINAKLLAMKSSALSLSLGSNFLDRSISISSSSVLSASVADGTNAGSYSATVNRLTSSSSFQSIGKAESTSTVNVPTIQKSVDTFTAAETFLAEDEEMTISYGYGGNRQTITITGESGGNTLSEVVTLINNDSENGGASLYVTASNVGSGDVNILQIAATGGGSGESNRVMITDPPDSTGFSTDLDRNISVSSSSVLSASIAHTAEIGSYSFDVTRLAANSSFQSDEKIDENVLVSSGADNFVYSMGNSGAISIAVDGTTTLSGLSTLINDDVNNPGVTASIVDSGSGKALLLEADDTGEDNRIIVTEQLDQLTMTESTGSGYTMEGDSTITGPIVINAGNADILFQEDSGSEITATIESGSYTESELAVAVKTALETASAASGNNKIYTVSFNSDTSKLEIQENGTLSNFKILWSDAGSTAAAALGFDAIDETITSAASSLNSAVEVDGTEYQNSSNTALTNLITGVSIDLTSIGTTTVDVTQGDGATFSYTIGDSSDISLRVTADTSLADLVTQINDDTNNPGVTASIINTGSGDSPYRLLLTADTAGEASRIVVTSQLADLAMTEANGSGFTMTSDTALSFTNPIIIRPDAPQNNTDIVFQEDDGNGYSSNITATIATGVYQNGADLATAVETALENASITNGSSKDYVVSFNTETSKLEIQEAGTLTNLKILWSDAGSTAATALGFDATDETITPADSSLNASITVDGIAYQRTKNTGITDVISGTTLSLIGAGNTTINVTQDSTAIKEHITTLITTFNDVIAEIDANDDYDEDTDTWGSLAKTPSIRSAKDILLSLLGTEISANENITTYYDLGFGINKDGSISLDETILDNKITSNFDDIKTFFIGTTAGAGVTGMGDLLNDQIKEQTKTNGLIDSETDALDDRLSRLVEQITTETERLDKRYETMAQQFVQLDSYMRQMESQQNYVSQIFSATEKKE